MKDREQLCDIALRLMECMCAGQFGIAIQLCDELRDGLLLKIDKEYHNEVEVSS